MFEIVAVWLQ